MAAIPTPSFLLFNLLLVLSSSPLRVSPDAGPPAVDACHKEDNKALVAFRDSFAPNTFGTWSSAFPCCEWYGVVCDETSGRVNELDIIGGSDVTHIPAVIGDLPLLQVIRFHKLPNLTGSIPPTITKLKLLRFLTVSWTALSGPVPAFLSKLTKLEQLDLSFNSLTGSIPPSLGDLPNCYAIDISRNNLTGTIPATLFSKAGGAQQPPSLTLSHNGLTGEIPRTFGHFNFSSIDLSRNRLTGDASFLFGRSKTVDELTLSRNELEFDLSTVEFPMIDLVLVDLSHNKIYGSIPKQIVEVTNFNFNFFNVSYNRLCGEIPTGGPMSQFDASCYIHNKCLCGTPLPPCKIPAQIAEVNNTNFNFFNVSYNRLCGEIPTGGPMSQFDASCYIHNKCPCGTPLPPCK